MEKIFAPIAGDRSKKIRVGFLTLPPLRARRKNPSFLANDNIGLRLILDVLRRANILTSPCDVYTAQGFEVVLVALNSTYDFVALLQSVRALEWWRPGKRKFAVVVGGPGLTNPVSIREFIDYAVFGRAEGFIADIISDILCGYRFQHESVMCLPEISPIKMAQASRLYPHPIGRWREKSIGCPNKCLFCLYCWSRKYIGEGNTYENLSLAGVSSPELMFIDLLKIKNKKGRVRSAIDGFSERLRALYGKRITNDDIVNVLEHLGSFGTTATVLTLYNICNFPGETNADIMEFRRTIGKARPKYRVIVVLHSTPFRPSNLTPMMWAPVDIADISRFRSRRIVDRADLMVTHSFTLEGSWSHFLTVLIERAHPGLDGAIWQALNLNMCGKMPQSAKLRELSRTFPWAMEDCTRAFGVGAAEHPASMIRGAYSWRTIEARARKINLTIN